jgi:hypothetical protein
VCFCMFEFVCVLTIQTYVFKINFSYLHTINSLKQWFECSQERERKREKERERERKREKERERERKREKEIERERKGEKERERERNREKERERERKREKERERESKREKRERKRGLISIPNHNCSCIRGHSRITC